MSKKLNLLFLAAILIFLCLGFNAAFAYTLSGIIYGGSNPLPNTTVNLFDAATQTQLGSTVTNSSGFYSFTNVNNGTYNLTIVPPTGSGFENAVVNGIPVNGGDLTQNVVLIQQAFTLSGVVRGPDGTPVSYIRVQVYEAMTFIKMGELVTNTSGSYSFPLAAGTYQIDAVKYGTPNIPTPQYFEIHYRHVTVSANTVCDINLPFVTLSGKTTDSNGVPVGGVTIKVPWGSYGWQGDINYGSSNENSPYIVSDASGNYSMLLCPYNNYSENILPPTGSGFAQTVVNNVSVTHDVLQNIILNIPDDDPPIPYGPTFTAITCNSAVVEWQTNEGAKGGLKYGTSSPPGNTITETNYYVLHSMPLTGLTPDTEYFVQVYGSDYYNNGPTYSDIVSFRTKLSCGDTIPPVFIEGPNVGHFACTGEVVTWRTDEPATGRVCYGQAEPLNTCVNAPNPSMSYQVVLNGLQADTAYLM